LAINQRKKGRCGKLLFV